MSGYGKQIAYMAAIGVVISLAIGLGIYYSNPAGILGQSTSTTIPSYPCTQGTETIIPQYQYNYVNINATTTTQTGPPTTRYVSVLDLPAGCSGSIIMTIHFPNDTISNNTIAFVAPNLNFYNPYPQPTTTTTGTYSQGCLWTMGSENATWTMNCSGITGIAYNANAASSPNLTFNVTIQFSAPQNMVTSGATYVITVPTINCAVDFLPPMFIGNNIPYWNPTSIQSCHTNPMVYPEITSVSLVNFTSLVVQAPANFTK
jgi:hypothetical protein